MRLVWLAMLGMTLGLLPLSGGVLNVTLDFQAQSNADVTYHGTHYFPSMSVNASDFASSQALAGTAQTPEARTAARVGGNEIAANARLDGKDHFDGPDIQFNFSTAIYTATVEKLAGPAEHVLLNFFLPPSYVETTTNVELLNAEVDSAIFAWIDVRACTTMGDCFGTDTRVFDFQAYTVDTYQNSSHTSLASGQTGLDVSPLINGAFTDTGAAGFLRTRNLSFPAFAGTVDLGVLSAGQIIQFQYELQARSTGNAAVTVGIASINDPFFLDSDPVRTGSPAAISTAAAAEAPEPGTLWLVALAAASYYGKTGVRRNVPRFFLVLILKLVQLPIDAALRQ